MRKITFLLILIISVSVLTGCNRKQVEAFNQDTLNENGIVSKAKVYTDAQYQSGDVPLHKFVQLKGKITDTDQKDNLVKKNARFVLKTDKGRYQIINDVEGNYEIGDTVIIYGEYYGFIKAMKIVER